MYSRLSYDNGYAPISDMANLNQNMLMDIGVYTLEDKNLEFYENEKEMAILLLEGKITISWKGVSESASRTNVFDEMPFCLHVPKQVKVVVRFEGKAQILVQKTDNDKEFEYKLYTQSELKEEAAGADFMEGTAKRLIRTIFDYSNAPYSNMVLGEVIAEQGRWSSYPPHYHDQPEVYYYKFDKPQGFGCAMIGDNAYKVYDHSYIAIPGGLTHPQATAPGYRMYFCWMIRHLEGNPWNQRIFDTDHEWMMK
jgi:hypothetical protein